MITSLTLYTRIASDSKPQTLNKFHPYDLRRSFAVKPIAKKALAATVILDE
ncbi:MAG: hypothetical protein WCS43_03645 [Verrucomicrobiota bacterium]